MSQSYRLKFSRDSLKMRVATRIPAQLVGGTGIEITKANGVYTFDLNYDEIGAITSYVDALEATTYLASWESVGDTFAKISIADFKTDLTASFDLQYQPLDAELTAIAGLTSAANKLPYFTGLGTASLADFTAAARTVLDDASTSDMRTTLGVAIGTDVQAYDAELAAIAGLTSAADKGFYFTGVGTASTFDLTSYGRSIGGVADEAAFKALVNLEIGTDVQAHHGNLDAFSGLTSAADKLPYFNGGGTPSMTVADFTAAGRSMVAAADAAAQTALLSNVVGDSGAGGTKGLVPAPAAGDAAASKFLKADGTWVAPTGSGDFVGPASSTDNAAVRFDSTTGKLGQNSALIIADTTGALSRSGNGGIPVQGTNTNDSAAAGYVGEVISASATSGSLTNATPVAVTSISLTAGDWDISASVQFNAGGATSSTDWYASISATSASIVLPIAGTLVAHERIPATLDHSQLLPITTARVSISSTTTYYINARGDFTGTAPTASAVIRARRAR